MDTMQRGVVTLLKSAVTQQSCTLPEGFDLEQAYPMVKRHHMSTLIYEGAVLCGIPREHPVMQQLFHSYCKALMVSEGQLREIDRICREFDENGIDYMLLKGSKMKRLYPKPELRIMGDADILIRMEQYDRIVPIMEGLGFARGIETDHELKWDNRALSIELHRLVMSTNHKGLHAYLGDGWQLATRKNGTRYDMSTEDEMVYLFTHFAKHYWDGGIGFRHMVDLWVFLRTYVDMDEAAVREKLEKLHLCEFYENIRKVIDVWFGQTPADEKTDFITEFIAESGSWGRLETASASRCLRNAAQEKDLKKIQWKFWLRSAFPGLAVLRNKYTILNKAPWMLPLIWLYRPIYKLLAKKERRSLKRLKTTLKATTADQLQSRQQALEYVGLGRHF